MSNSDDEVVPESIADGIVGLIIGVIVGIISRGVAYLSVPLSFFIMATAMLLAILFLFLADIPSSKDPMNVTVPRIVGVGIMILSLAGAMELVYEDFIRLQSEKTTPKNIRSAIKSDKTKDIEIEEGPEGYSVTVGYKFPRKKPWSKLKESVQKKGNEFMELLFIKFSDVTEVTFIAYTKEAEEHRDGALIWETNIATFTLSGDIFKEKLGKNSGREKFVETVKQSGEYWFSEPTSTFSDLYD